MNAEIKCEGHHIWSDTTEDMEGKPCDCGKFLWHMEPCGCPGENKPEFKMIPNPNYKGGEE